MTYRESVAQIGRRELATSPAAVPGSYGKQTGLAYGLLYLAGVFAFSIAAQQGVFKMKGRR